jgi:two-component system chemotaxis response regulator CheB
MFRTVAKVEGLQFVAGILTGMGRDGAEGLLALKNVGARTFAQDEASSTVYGMPRAAFENGAAEEVCSLDQVATTMLNLSHGVHKRSA